MDPADTDNPDSPPDRVLRAISNQGAVIGRHDQLLQALIKSQETSSNQIAQLNAMLQQLTTNISTFQSPVQPPAAEAQAFAATPPLLPPREPHVPDPEHYSGDMGKCGGFLLQCSLVFSQRPATYSSSASKIAFIMGLLQGKALDWATAVWQNDPLIRNNFEVFQNELRKVFDHPVKGKEASKRLLNLSQGPRSVAEYSVEFRTLAAEAGWDDTALQSVFTNGLSEQLKDELALKDDSHDLDSLVSTAIKIDNRLRERRRERTTRHVTSSTTSRSAPPRVVFSAPSTATCGQPPPASSEVEPMQLGRAKLTPAERQRRIQSGECIYCGQLGHFLITCPSRPKGPAHQ